MVYPSHHISVWPIYAVVGMGLQRALLNGKIQTVTIGPSSLTTLVQALEMHLLSDCLFTGSETLNRTNTAVYGLPWNSSTSFHQRGLTSVSHVPLSTLPASTAVVNCFPSYLCISSSRATFHTHCRRNRDSRQENWEGSMKKMVKLVFVSANASHDASHKGFDHTYECCLWMVLQMYCKSQVTNTFGLL